MTEGVVRGVAKKKSLKKICACFTDDMTLKRTFLKQCNEKFLSSVHEINSANLFEYFNFHSFPFVLMNELD